MDHSIEVVVCDCVTDQASAAGRKRIPVDLLHRVQNLIISGGHASVDVNNEDLATQRFLPC